MIKIFFSNFFCLESVNFILIVIMKGLYSNIKETILKNSAFILKFIRFLLLNLILD